MKGSCRAFKMSKTVKDIDKSELLQVSSLIKDRLGLNYRENRLPELINKLSAICKDLNLQDIGTLKEMIRHDRLSEDQAVKITRHLTVGETFFFRDSKVFDIFHREILPEIISSKKTSNRQINILSAGCSTGEEPYTIAIILKRCLVDLKDWQIGITALDINDSALDTARKGLYKNWSFRGAPEWLKGAYFSKVGKDLYEISDEIKVMVKFIQFNLANSPSEFKRRFANFDVIFCRNVIMYFDNDLRQQIADTLYDALVDKGWLIVSPVEASADIFRRYNTIIYNKTTLFRRHESTGSSESSVSEGALQPAPSLPKQVVFKRQDNKVSVKRQGVLPTVKSKDSQVHAGRYSALGVQYDVSSKLGDAVKMANSGSLDEALALLDDLIGSNRLNPQAHYLKALVLEEMGNLQRAEESLRSVIYLEGDSAITHFRLGNIFFKTLRFEEALREFNNVISLLEGHDKTDRLSGFSDINRDRLLELSRELAREIKIR